MGGLGYIEYKDKQVSVLAVLLVIAIIAVSINIIFIYKDKAVRDAKLTLDKEIVTEAMEMARVQYMTDNPTGGSITYYYDLDRKAFKDASRYYTPVRDITGYGQTLAKDNKKGETGAVGIPNTGKEHGEQFLAIVVDNGEFSARWQGAYLTEYDYEIMTPAERERLTNTQMDQILIDKHMREGKQKTE